jgi:hypothetical protein
VFGGNDDRNPHHANNEKVMKNLLIVFSALFITGYVFTIAHAKPSPQIDEIDALLNKVSKNLQSAGEVTKMAQTMNAKMVESKVAEKEALKESVKQAEAKVQTMQSEMINAGLLDTSTSPMKGPAYDAYVEYQKNGGDMDFEYFRLYIWQQK